LTDIYIDRIDGSTNGQTVCSETKTILERLFSLDLHHIENECNRVADLYSEKWSAKNPDDFMIKEDDLDHTTYKSGIRELYPPFLLTEVRRCSSSDFVAFDLPMSNSIKWILLRALLSFGLFDC
jgi:hypothetical protein